MASALEASTSTPRVTAPQNVRRRHLGEPPEELQTACTDSNACNYDETATLSDVNACDFGDACNDGDSGTINDFISENCECLGDFLGCTDPEACNYNPVVTENDGSCTTYWMYRPKRLQL